LDDDQDGGWLSVSSGTGSPGSSTKGRKMVVVVVSMYYRLSQFFPEGLSGVFYNPGVIPGV